MIEKINSQSNIQSMLQTLKAFQAQAAGGIDEAGGKVGGTVNAQAARRPAEGPARPLDRGGRRVRAPLVVRAAGEAGRAAGARRDRPPRAGPAGGEGARPRG